MGLVPGALRSSESMLRDAVAVVVAVAVVDWNAVAAVDRKPLADSSEGNTHVLCPTPTD